jgi:hypothetical protein
VHFNRPNYQGSRPTPSLSQVVRRFATSVQERGLSVYGRDPACGRGPRECPTTGCPCRLTRRSVRLWASMASPERAVVERSAEPAERVCRSAVPHSASGTQRRVRRLAALSAPLSHGLGTGSPTRSREQRALTCTFGGPLRARTCDLRLRRGGSHASLGRSTSRSRSRTDLRRTSR